MAITQNPLIGRASGSFAGAVFSSSFGKNIIRSKPVQVSNPNTDAQKLVREKFSAVSTPLRAALPFFKNAYKDDALDMPVYSYLMGYAYKNAAGGSLGAVTVNMDVLSPAADINGIASALTIDKSINGQVSIEWNSSTLTEKLGADATLTALVIDNDTGEVYSNLTEHNIASDPLTINVNGDLSLHELYVYIMPKKKNSRFKAGNELAVIIA
jgi:hypothetical protein